MTYFAGHAIPGVEFGDEQLLRTMVGQQISIAAARTTSARLSRELDGTGLFPTASQFANRGLEALGPVPQLRRRALVAGGPAALTGNSLWPLTA